MKAQQTTRTSHNSTRKLKICMLLPDRYQPNMLIYSRLGILNYLTRFGHQITWIMSSEKDYAGNHFRINEAEVHTVPYLHDFPRPSLSATVSDQIRHSYTKMRYTLKLFRNEKYDMILVRDSILSLFDTLLAVYIRRKYKIPFVFELPNPLEQQRQFFKLEYGTSYYLFARLNAFIARHLLHKADLLLPISDTLKEHLVQQGVPQSKIMTLLQGIDTEKFSVQNGSRIRERYCWNNCQVLIYVGIIRKLRHLDVLIQAFQRLKQKTENIKLLMVGDGNDKQDLEKLADSLGLKDDILFTGRVLPSEVPDFIAAADIGICPVPPLPAFKFSAPIKLFEYMAMAKPVIANEEIPEHEDVLKKSGGGILVPFTAEAFADAMVNLLKSPRTATSMGQLGQQWVIRNRSYEILARQVSRRLVKLLSEFDSRRQSGNNRFEKIQANMVS